MNKKVNSAIFILVATIVNVGIMILLFLLFLFLHVRLLAPILSPEASQIIWIVIFFLAVALTYIIYNALMKLFAAKVDMEKYFDPLLRPRKPKK